MLPNNEGSNSVGRTLVVGSEFTDLDETIKVAKALASQPRARILEYLHPKVASLSEIARDLNMPVATAALHLSSLERAGILSSQTAPGKRGQQRIYTRIRDTVVFHLPAPAPRSRDDRFYTHMPVGAFIAHEVVPPCGLAGVESLIGMYDDPVGFYEPDRFHAQLVWLSHGWLEYRFPNHARPRRRPKSLRVSLEICSEAAPSADDWLSDIFLDVNGVRIGAWTSPADFGDIRGSLTPAWWDDWNSQYGQLKVWQVDNHGAYIDGRRISAVTVDELDLPAQPYIVLRIGIDDDAENKGGLNIFGRDFGNHAQDIIMQIDYD